MKHYLGAKFYVFTIVTIALTVSAVMYAIYQTDEFATYDFQGEVQHANLGVLFEKRTEGYRFSGSITLSNFMSELLRVPQAGTFTSLSLQGSGLLNVDGKDFQLESLTLATNDSISTIMMSFGPVSVTLLSDGRVLEKPLSWPIDLAKADWEVMTLVYQGVTSYERSSSPEGLRQAISEALQKTNFDSGQVTLLTVR